MSVGLLIIAHAPFGTAALETTVGTLGTLPLSTELLDLPRDCDLEQAAAQARALYTKLEQGDGVLILTDLYGATPSNIATQLVSDATQCKLVSGLNLSMLIRVMNYPELPLQELAQKAQSGGQGGIFLYPPVAHEGELIHA